MLTGTSARQEPSPLPGEGRTVKRIFVPTLLTLGNGVCGFAAIAYASKIAHDGSLTSDQVCRHYLLASSLIFLAMVFDLLDGYAARLYRCASEFGGQLDSLCDAISFGAAPAFLLMRLGQGLQAPLARQALAVIAALYVVCAVLRLARFNLQNTTDPASHKRFKGLPSPGAAGCVASLALLRFEPTYEWVGLDSGWVQGCVRAVTLFAPVGTLLVALLMVSRLSYPHMTKQILRGRRHFSYLVRVILAAFLIFMLREMALALLFWGYALSIPLRYALTRGLRGKPLPAPEPGLDQATPH
jgi:CDP-diacylglycerol---serine O-phosphatidyltransferase